MNYSKLIKEVEKIEIEPVGRHSFSYANIGQKTIAIAITGLMSAGFLYGGYNQMRLGYGGTINLVTGGILALGTLSMFGGKKIILDFDRDEFAGNDGKNGNRAEFKLSEVEKLSVNEGGIWITTNRKESIYLKLMIGNVSEFLALLKNYLPQEKVNIKRF